MESLNTSELLTTINIPINLENTYEGEDGLLYCTKCHTRRVTKDIIQPFGKRMPVSCECMKEAEQKAQEQKEYIIKSIDTDDAELNAFLFSLGCYAGEPITVVSRRRSGCTVSIKDGRYNIDNALAEAIIV